MRLRIKVDLEYRLARATDVLLQIEAADMEDQRVLEAGLDVGVPVDRVEAEDGIGARIWLRTEGNLQCSYRAEMAVERDAEALETLPASVMRDLPGEAVRYLLPSRYCPSDEFQSFVAAEFGGLEGGAQIAAFRDWIAAHFAYVPGASNAQTTALDTFVQRQGICRDFAHVLITLARAAAIPARFASVYAPEVSPPDFHAVAEVYLDGGWHLVDPTGMAEADEMVRIGVGADAAGVAFMTTFGPAEFVAQRVWVECIEGQD